MEGFDRIKHTCRADLNLTTETLFCEIVMLPCRVKNGIRGLFYVLRSVV